MASPEFRTWWAEHDVATRNSGTKRYRHPVVGEMTIHFEAMRLADVDQLLFHLRRRARHSVARRDAPARDVGCNPGRRSRTRVDPRRRRPHVADDLIGLARLRLC